MGKFHLGPDEARVLALKQQYGLTTFVETGTYKGATARWASAHFDEVYTIEAYAPRIEAWYQHPDYIHARHNTHLVEGDSRVKLGELLARLDRPTLLWLDAHWCGDGAKEAHAIGDECPLREELAAVLADSWAAKHVIMIDDARLFTDPIPYPHDPTQWCSYAEIQMLLAGREVFIDQDIIYGLPRS